MFIVGSLLATISTKTWSLIDKGQATVAFKGGRTAVYKKGRAFGELAVLFGRKEEITVTAAGQSAIWVIDREKYKNITSL